MAISSGKSADAAPPVAVLAGTPVDTQMGAALLAAGDWTPLAFPLAEDPRSQTAFQLSSPAEKQSACRTVLETARSRGCRQALVYCNSLSSSVDFDILAEETGLEVVTPLHIYRALPQRHHCLGVVAANAQGLAGIERTLYQADPTLDLRSVSLLPVVLAIEAGLPPERIVAEFRLAELAEWLRVCGAEALVLGCTHFPYIKEALAVRTALPLIDPAGELLSRLTPPTAVTDR